MKEWKIFLFLIAIIIVLGFIGAINPGAKNSIITRSNQALSATIKIDPPVNPGSTFSEKEYITIHTQPEVHDSYFLSEWILKSALGTFAHLGNTVNIPLEGKINNERPTLIPEGSAVVVNSGHSPIGVSFRLNSCSGFLAEHQEFTPDIPRECPNALDILPPNVQQNLDASCREYLNSFAMCSTQTDNFPDNLSMSCKKTISEMVNYNQCVATNSKNPDFLKNEWRVYLHKDKPLWQSSVDFISLFDLTGKILGSVSY